MNSHSPCEHTFQQPPTLHLLLQVVQRLVHLVTNRCVCFSQTTIKKLEREHELTVFISWLIIRNADGRMTLLWFGFVVHKDQDDGKMDIGISIEKANIK